MGRSNISHAALGTSHSLFLDGDGGVWTCGENKEVSDCDMVPAAPVGSLTNSKQSAQKDCRIDAPDGTAGPCVTSPTISIWLPGTMWAWDASRAAATAAMAGVGAQNFTGCQSGWPHVIPTAFYSPQGQCGLGTQLELLARQRRQEWALGTNLATFAQAFSEVAREHAGAPDSQV